MKIKHRSEDASTLQESEWLQTDGWLAARRPGVAIVGRVGSGILPERGEPPVRLEPLAVLERAGVV